MVRGHVSRWSTFIASLVTCATASAPLASAADPPRSTADHTKHEALQRPFASGPEVTKACLSCHTEAASQIMHTTHWTWAFDGAEALGKRSIVNSFCGAVGSNEPRCTSCHVGYGWTDTRKSPEEAGLGPEQVDCLVCHDTTGTYTKLPAGAGHPAYAPFEESGKQILPPDLTRIAQNVGATSRQTCGACHFFGGGGDGVKHGDLDSSLTKPPRDLDVHMSPMGAGFTCATCHNPSGHVVPGSHYSMTAVDRGGRDVPGAGYSSHATCESCHGARPHEESGRAQGAKLDDHTDVLACPTCHVPEFARGGVATKLSWDWSTAGKLDERGKIITKKDVKGHSVYDSRKGSFELGENVVPTYAWFNGVFDYTLKEEKIDPGRSVPINRLGGGPGPDSRIWPFKVMRGKQPFDEEHKTLLVAHLFGKDDAAYWRTFDWQKALTAGAEYVGQPFSGKYGFAETTYHWPITHMVAPAEEALECGDCHVASGGRMAGIDGIFVPGRDNNEPLDLAGFGLVGLALLGSAGHGVARALAGRRRGRKA